MYRSNSYGHGAYGALLTDIGARFYNYKRNGNFTDERSLSEFGIMVLSNAFAKGAGNVKLGFLFVCTFLRYSYVEAENIERVVETF